MIEAEKEFGKIHGVIHCAGLPDGGMIQFRERAVTDPVLAPKVKGTAVIDRLFQGVSLDFIILCSSINSIVPTFGQAGYFAANSFLDAYAPFKRKKDGTFTVAINWDAWREVGMSAARSAASVNADALTATVSPNTNELATELGEVSGQGAASVNADALTASGVSTTSGQGLASANADALTATVSTNINESATGLGELSGQGAASANTNALTASGLSTTSGQGLASANTDELTATVSSNTNEFATGVGEASGQRADSISGDNSGHAAMLANGILPPEGIEVLRRILASDPSQFPELSQVIVSTIVLEDRYRQWAALDIHKIENSLQNQAAAARYERPDLPTPYTAPRNEAEARLAEIWQEVLMIDKIGIDDEYFELGGDSLKALKVIAAAKNQNIEISITDIFKYKTIAKILENKENDQAEKPAAPSGEEQSEAAATDPGKEAPVSVREADHPATVPDITLAGIPEKMELKIVMQKEVTTYLHRAIHLCIVLTDPDLYPWFYEHYINIFSQTDPKGVLKLDYLEVFAAHRDMLLEYRYSPELIAKEPDLISFIIEKINRNYYLLIQADEYYLPGKRWYGNNHFILPNLVYGYDNIKRTVKCLGYDMEAGGVFQGMDISYADFVEAYEQGRLRYQELAPPCLKTSVILYERFNYDGAYPFNIGRFLQELKNYLNSTGNESIPYFWKLPGKKTYGFNVYDEVISHLEGLLKGKMTIGYNAIHLLYEHKNQLARRFKFIMDHYKIKGPFLDLYQEYLKVVELFNKPRLKFFDLEYNTTAEDLRNSREKLGAAIREIIAAIRLAKEQERTVLVKLYEILQDKFRV